jgi:hypothetical protein
MDQAQTVTVFGFVAVCITANVHMPDFQGLADIANLHNKPGIFPIRMQFDAIPCTKMI